MAEKKGKIIRDVVHGDIFIEDKYLAIIDTKEFQRLHRIKQLSVANMVFPGAEHTRFAHCVGTYYVMGKIIEHFEPIFEKCGLKIDEEEKEAALAAALLHDIGHGPYSHAFEGALKKLEYSNVSHEEMSERIITSEETEVNKVLVEKFGEDFPERVADIIMKKRDVKKKNILSSTSKPDLQFVLSSLLSSQLDADRMDYLLRDSWYTGAKYGSIDLSRTISAMSLAINPENDQFCVCVGRRYLVDIENCLLGRYQMHKEVYYHSIKCEMEQVISRILVRAKWLYEHNKLENAGMLPEAIKVMFSGQELTISQYTSLDDNLMHYLFWNWMQSKDPELSALCDTLINRKKYTKISLRRKTDVNHFKAELSELMERQGYEADIEKEAFLLTVDDDLNMYKTQKENIFVQDEFGSLLDIGKVSQVLNFEKKEEKGYIFINFDMIESKYKDEGLGQKIRNLTEKYRSRNQVEREAKYIVDSKDVWKEVYDVISSMNGYRIHDKGINDQTDVYYDTEDKLLKKNDITLRIRTIGERHICTVKTPLRNEKPSEKDTHSVRYEYEEEVESNQIQDCFKFFSEKSDVFSGLKADSFAPVLEVKNHRTKYNISEKTDPSVKFEMVFDDVTYRNYKNNNTKHDYQVEIELKSEYLHEVRLRMLTTKLEKDISQLKINKTSKYKRGLELICH